MSEWLVTIETPSGVLASADELEQVALAIDDDERARGAALGMNAATGSASATFTVSAEMVAQAVTIAVDVVRRALDGAGFDRPGWRVEIEQDVVQAEERELAFG